MRIFMALACAALVFTGCPEDEGTPIPDADAVSGVKVDTTPDADAAVEVVAAPDTAPDGETDTAPDADAAVEVDAAPDVEADADATVEVDATPDAEVDTTPDVEVDTAPDAVDGGDVGPDSDIVVPTCTSACDCEQGWACVGGTCLLGVKPVFCCSNAGCPDDEACVNSDETAGLCGVTTAAEFGEVIFNEVLTDGEVNGDPNGDGDSADSVGDEFVEIVNVGSAAVDMAGWTLMDSSLTVPRHTFAAGTSLAAGSAMVVFGGGTAPDDTATATFVVANAADPGFSFGLSLDNANDSMSLLDDEGALVAVFAYGDGAALAAISDQSYTRDPDLTGPFVGHDGATGAAGTLFSPGTTIDGSSF